MYVSCAVVISCRAKCISLSENGKFLCNNLAMFTG